MSTLEIKKELHEIIDKSDAVSIENFYEIIKNYFNTENEHQMIEEGEQDILNNDIFTHQEIKDIVAKW